MFRASSGSAKNSSNTFIVDHDSSAQSITPVNNLGGSFSQSSKEKHWHQTNSSDVNFLPSYKTLDVPKGEEGRLLPATKVGVPQKLNLNQSKAYVKVRISMFLRLLE